MQGSITSQGDNDDDESKLLVYNDDYNADDADDNGFISRHAE